MRGEYRQVGCKKGTLTGCVLLCCILFDENVYRKELTSPFPLSSHPSRLTALFYRGHCSSTHAVNRKMLHVCLSVPDSPWAVCLEPLTSVVISSEPLCRSTKSWQLVPRNSMVIVEGTPPEAASTANGKREEGDGDTAATAAATPPAQKKGLSLGLVSSIRYEPLRCHASDAPAPDNPASSNPASLLTSCSTVRPSTCGSLGSDNGIGDSSRACPVVKASAH